MQSVVFHMYKLEATSRGELRKERAGSAQGAWRRGCAGGAQGGRKEGAGVAQVVLTVIIQIKPNQMQMGKPVLFKFSFNS